MAARTVSEIIDGTLTIPGTLLVTGTFNETIGDLVLGSAAPNMKLQVGGAGNYYEIASPGNPGQDTTVSLYDPGVAACDLQLGIKHQSNIGATAALTTADSGKIIKVTNATGGNITLTLPAVAAGIGCHFVFILDVTGMANDIRIAGAAGTPMHGLIIDDTANTPINPSTAGVNFISGTALAGDMVDIYGDGIVWSVRGFSGAPNGITAT